MDDFACALFGPVLFVTLSYYGLQFLPLDPLYGEDYQVVCLASSVLSFLCLLFVPILPTCDPFFPAVPKSACAVTTCSLCTDGMPVFCTGAELLSASGLCPDKACLLSGECAPREAARLLLKRHLCKSSRPSFHPEPSHALEYQTSSCIADDVFHGLHLQDMPLLHACNENKP